ncbi:MAG: hypothetical protein MJ094_04345 [Saccharofermentans sp.]|nr:hypothetical protein [Saccharofermentans sp.]
MLNNVIRELKAKPKLEMVTTLFAWLVCAFFLVKLIAYFGTAFFQTAVYHIPIEYRDMSTLSVAKAFSEWKNPYSVSYSQGLNTPIAYQYTFVVPMIIALIHNVTHLDFVLSALIMNYMFIFIAVLFIYHLLKEFCSIKVYWVVPIFYFTTCGFSMFIDRAPGFTARGDALGIAILAIIYWLVAKHKDKIVLISFLSALLFYTKSTDVFLALPVFVYYLIDNWKSAIKYFFCCIGFGVASIILVRLLFPLFFVENIYYLLGGVLDRGDIVIAQENYGAFFSSNVVLNTFFRIGLVAILIKIGFSIYKDGFKTAWNKYGVIAMMLFAAVIYPELLTLFKASFIIGDGYKYCNSLMFEPYFVVATYFIYTLAESLPNWILPELNNDDVVLKNSIRSVVGAISIIYICNACFSYYEWKLPSVEHCIEWEDTLELCSQYDLDKIYFGPMIATYALNQDNGLETAFYDSGHTEYNGSENANMDLSNVQDFKNIFIFNTVDAEDELIENYDADINSRISEGYFDLLIVPRYGTVFIDIEDLDDNYEKVDEIHLTSFINECYYGVYVRR